MNRRKPAGDLLVRIAPWGQVSIVESDGHVVEVQRLATQPGRQQDIAAAVASWKDFRHHAITPILQATVAQTSSEGEVLEVRRQAPAGSTLAELLDAHGPLDAVLLAGLFLELVVGVNKAHKQGLVVGAISPHQLFVCPPGISGVAACVCHQAGLLAFVAAAQGPVGGAENPRFSAMYDEIALVPPEVSEGKAHDAAADTYMLCAIFASALLGRQVHAGVDNWASRQRARSGLTPADTVALEQAAPGVGRVLVKGLSVEPLLRRGMLSELASAFRSLLGEPRVRKVLVTEGGDPWRMGSPLIPLAAYVRARPYAERFSEQRDAQQRRASSTGRVQQAAPVPARSGQSGVGNIDQARLSAAISELKLLRAKAEQEERKGPSPLVQGLVIVVTIAIAWAIAWIGLRQTQTLDPHKTTPGFYKGKPIPKPPQPRVLYTTPRPE